jgi:hypothetical protein
VLTAPRDKNDNPDWASHVMNVEGPVLVMTCATADDSGGVGALVGSKSTPGVAEDVVDEDITVLLSTWTMVAAEISATALPSPETSSLESQITSRMGKSFGQLLTKRAVLIAFGLAVFGGGRGCNCAGAVEIRLSCGPECGVGVNGDALVE